MARGFSIDRRHGDDAAVNHAQRFGGGKRQVEHAALDERPAVGDNDDHAAIIGRSVTRSGVPNGSVR